MTSTLTTFIGDPYHYVVPACTLKPSFVSEVTTKVKALQSIVDSMTIRSNPEFTSTALSYFSKTLILAVGIATCQRLIDQPDLCTADETYVRRVVSAALIVKNDDQPDLSSQL